MQDSDLGILFLLKEQRIDFNREYRRMEELQDLRKKSRKDFRVWLGTMLITAGLRLKGNE